MSLEQPLVRKTWISVDEEHSESTPVTLRRNSDEGAKQNILAKNDGIEKINNVSNSPTIPEQQTESNVAKMNRANINEELSEVDRSVVPPEQIPEVHRRESAAPEQIPVVPRRESANGLQLVRQKRLDEKVNNGVATQQEGVGTAVKYASEADERLAVRRKSFVPMSSMEEENLRERLHLAQLRNCSVIILREPRYAREQFRKLFQQKVSLAFY